MRGLVNDGGAGIIIGSILDPEVIAAQKKLLMHVILEVRDNKKRKIIIFSNHTKHLISPELLQSLELMIDSDVHIALSYHTPADLDEVSELHASDCINQNCKIKFITKPLPQNAEQISKTLGFNLETGAPAFSAVELLNLPSCTGIAVLGEGDLRKITATLREITQIKMDV
jgi:hypothetical protein